MSQRTDGGPPTQPIRVPTGGTYGQAQALQAVEAAAPMAASPGPAAAPKPRAAGRGPASAPTAFGAPTQRPHEPVTTGAALGPGPGPEALGLGSPGAAEYQSALTTLQSLATVSGSSEVGALFNQMQLRN